MSEALCDTISLFIILVFMDYVLYLVTVTQVPRKKDSKK